MVNLGIYNCIFIGMLLMLTALESRLYQLVYRLKLYYINIEILRLVSKKCE